MITVKEFIKSSRLLRMHRRYLCSSSGSKNRKSKKYADTLNLPRTQFQLSMKDVSTREKEVQSLCSFEALYAWQRENNTGPEFILHDGPPYANGKPHVGHAINKILKDIVNRYHMLRGDCVHYMPGWDCHGLPIELKALKGKSSRKLTPLQIRDEARKFAKEAIRVQMEGFQRWGVMADWQSQAYYTFDAQYEVKQIEAFYQLFEKGYVYQDVMPVYWSPSSRTALAESELEYNEKHVSTAIYVRLPISHKPDSIQQLTECSNKPLYAVIWTTTPWTLPANQAVAFNENINYSVLEDRVTGDQYLCEDIFGVKLAQLTGRDLSAVTIVPGTELTGTKYHHPLTNEELPFLPGSHVTPNKGTGLVHTAPAHGHDDFHLAKKFDLKMKEFLDERCCYTAEAGEKLAGQSVGQAAESLVLEALGNHVMHQSQFTHSYPYDWRTKKPVIIKTSKQWFIDTQTLKQKALDCLKDVKFLPANQESLMVRMLETRPHWCISRQRVWGVPIPVFYHKQTKLPLINRETINHVQELISTHGSDCWWTLTDEQLLPNKLLNKVGAGSSEDYERGQDILDIWFDSGVSWSAVLDSGKQADVYMEGTDQFRGWFQSSLLTSVALRDVAPYRSLVVHGLTMDEEGRKMSKSLGNVIDPDIVIHGGKNKQKEPAYGADVLRWWAALSNLQSTSTIGPEKLNQIREDLYELRKTLRFLLGNISCDISPDLVDYTELWPQDQYMLYELYQLASKIPHYYDNYEYVQLLKVVDVFCKNKVSRQYSTMIKDRCYCEETSVLARQASLTTQYHLLDVLVRAVAPILPHLSEDIYFHYPQVRRKQGVDSVFKTGWFSLKEEWNNPGVLHTVQPVFDIRDHLHDVISTDVTGEYDVTIYASKLLHNRLQEMQKAETSSTSPLCEMLQVASTTLSEHNPPQDTDNSQTVTGVCQVHMADGFQCPEKYTLVLKETENIICERCRRYTAPSPNTLCPRCLEVLAIGWE